MSDRSVTVTTDQGIIRQVADTDRRLRETITADATFADFATRAEACQDAFTLAQEHPEAVQQLVSPLVSVLREELNRGGATSADQLVLANLSRQIQRDAARTLAAMTDPGLATVHADPDTEFPTFVRTLTNTLCDGSGSATRLAGLQALSSISRVRPSEVRDLVSADRLIPVIGRLISGETSAADLRSGAEVLIVLSRDVPSELLNINDVQDVIDTVAECDGRWWCVYGELLADICSGIGIPSNSVITVSSTLADLLERARKADGEERKRATRRLGLAVSLTPHLVTDPPQRLLERVRNTTHDDRWRAARAAGELLAADPAASRSRVGLQRDRVRSATGTDRQHEAGVLGEIVVAYPDRFDHIPESFVTALQRDSQPTGDALSAVGECVTISADCERSVRESVLEQIRSSDGERQQRALIALGEWAGCAPIQFQDTPTRVIEELHAGSGEDRRSPAFALGILALENEAWSICLNAVHTDGTQRRLLSRALGELATATPSHTRFPRTQITSLRERSGADRRWAMQALGVAIAHASSTHETPLASLQHWVRTATETGYQQRIRLLGEWVITAPEGALFDATQPAHHVEATQGTNRERAAYALGEAVVSTADFDRQPLLAMLKRTNWALEVERVAAHSLATTLGTRAETASDSPRLKYLCPTERDPKWVLEMVGEYAALTPGLSLQYPEQLRTAVQEGTHWDRKQAAYALGVSIAIMTDPVAYPAERLLYRTNSIGTTRQAGIYTLGEVAAAVPEPFCSLPSSLVHRVRSTRGTNRTLAARALGVAVAAIPLDEEFSLDAVLEVVDRKTGKSRRQGARAVGELVVALSDCFESIPQAFITDLAESTGQKRRDWAEALGEVVLSSDPKGAVRRLVDRHRPASVFERERRIQVLMPLARYGMIGPEQLLQVVATSTAGIQSDGRLHHLLPEFREPNRQSLLQTLETAVEQETDWPSPSLHSQIRKFILSDSITNTTSRLLLVEMLASFDEAITPGTMVTES